MQTPVFPEFRELQENDYSLLAHAASRRPSMISEGHPLNYLLWRGYYHLQFSQLGEAILFLVHPNDTSGFLMPWCTEEEFPSVFRTMKTYSLEHLKDPFALYLLDEPAKEWLTRISSELDGMKLYEERDDEDYIYEAESLRTLRGKKLHKKKNHWNQFIRNYDGLYEYVTLTPKDAAEINEMYQEWKDSQLETDASLYIDYEWEGLKRLFEADSIQVEDGAYYMAGIRICGKLQAFTLGSYDSSLRCAFIHTEKAIATIPGLYAVMNQQFITNAFPEALWVNREDDLGEEGLRMSKLSYHPHHLEKKYHLVPLTQGDKL